MRPIGATSGEVHGAASRLIDEGDGLPELTGGCRHPGGLELTERVVELAGLPSRAAVLDVGCGDGATAAHLERRFGLRVIGVDRSAAFVRRGRERCLDLDLREGTAERLPLPDASVDAVLAECVLSILDEPAAALEEWARVLRPGGRLLVNDLYRRVDPDAARRLLTRLGFAVEAWEDHSSALARLVWELAGGGALRTRRSAGAYPPGADPGVSRARANAPAALRRGGGLGYYLCIARYGDALGEETTRHE